MKKTIYEVSLPTMSQSFYCSKQQDICDFLNNRFKINKYNIKTIGYYIYQQKPENQSNIIVTKHNTEDYLKRYIDCYVDTIQTKLDTLHKLSVKRLIQRYIMVIEAVVIQAKNAQRNEKYIDEQVRLAYPLLNISFPQSNKLITD